MTQQPPPQRSLFDLFDDAARQAVHQAREEVVRTKREAIGPEHLLGGLARVEGGLFGQVLADAKLDRQQLLAALDEVSGFGTTATPPTQLPFTPPAQQVMQIVMQAAAASMHSTIRSEHLLLALLQDPQGPLAKALEKLGTNRDPIGKALMPRFQAIPRDPRMEAQARAAAEAQSQQRAAQALSGLTPSAQRVLDEARRQAQELGHGQLGTPHLLLALLVDQDRLITNLFIKLGLRPEEARSELLRQLRAAPQGAPAAQA
jgi:ATP-dependent Clp protease ATP-binding subunit ClpC